MPQPHRKSRAPWPAWLAKATFRRTLSYGLVVFALAALAVGGYPAWQSFWASLDRKSGLQLAEQGRFANAEPLLRSAYNHNPNDADVVKALALGYASPPEHPDAVSWVARWAHLQSNRVEPQRLHMNLLLDRGRRPEAIAAGLRVLELKPGDEDVRALIVRVLLDEGRFAEAEQTCRRGLIDNPTHPILRVQLADSCSRQGKTAEAQSLLDDLIAKHPTYPLPYLYRGILHCQAGEEKPAIPLLRKAIALDPTLKSAYHQLAQALARIGETAEAERVTAQFLHLNSLERALKDVEIQPDNIDLKVKAAELLLTSERTEEASRLLRDALKKDPGHTGAKRLLATIPAATK